MIATTSPASQTILPESANPEIPARWQQLAADAITDPAELLSILDLDTSLLPTARRAAQIFGLRVPRGFVAKMKRGNPNDPLLRQVLPLVEELQSASGYSHDPVGDLASRTAQGVLQKYSGRALLISTGACAIHCRYCFRRHFPYSDETASSDRWRAAIEFIRSNPSLNEVILSGGDPLNLSNIRLAELTAGIEGARHIKRLRIHTRTAAVIPERIDAGLLQWLDGLRFQKIVVLHINHAQEIDRSLRSACARLKDVGVTVLNQSVLLAGVNDSVTALAELSESLFEAGVMPYYLSTLDRVAGASHFEVAAPKSAQLLRELTSKLPGYLIPKLVREVAGADSKTSVSLFT